MIVFKTPNDFLSLTIKDIGHLLKEIWNNYYIQGNVCLIYSVPAGVSCILIQRVIDYFHK